jgi:MFS family permease
MKGPPAILASSYRPAREFSIIDSAIGRRGLASRFSDRKVRQLEQQGADGASGYRWVVLASFGLVLFSQALLWLTFAPIETEVQAALGVGHFPVRFLALVDPITFIVLAIGIGILADRRGFRFTVGLGLALMIPAAIMRAVAAHLGLSGHTLYWILLAMQVIISAGACCCIVCIFQMPVKWFPESQRAGAAGLTSMSLLFGNAAVFPLVVLIANLPSAPSQAQAMQGLSRVLDVLAIIVTMVAILFFALVRYEPQTQRHEGLLAPGLVRRLLKLPDFRALTLVFFFGMGLYIALMITMEKMMAFHGFSTTYAAVIAGAMTFGGIIGCAIVPRISESMGRRRPFIFMPALVAIPLAVAVAFLPVAPVDLIAAFLLGFLMLAAQPIIFTMVGEMKDVGPGLAGTAVGILFGIGSIGQIVVPLLMELFVRTSPSGLLDYRWSILILAAVGIVSFLAIMRDIPETGSIPAGPLSTLYSKKDPENNYHSGK